MIFRFSMPRKSWKFLEIIFLMYCFCCFFFNLGKSDIIHTAHIKSATAVKHTYMSCHVPRQELHDFTVLNWSWTTHSPSLLLYVQILNKVHFHSLKLWLFCKVGCLSTFRIVHFNWNIYCKTIVNRSTWLLTGGNCILSNFTAAAYIVLYVQTMRL